MRKIITIIVFFLTSRIGSNSLTKGAPQRCFLFKFAGMGKWVNCAQPHKKKKPGCRITNYIRKCCNYF